MGAQHPAVHNIDPRREEPFDETHDIRIVERADLSRRVQIQHHVYVAVGSTLASRDGTKQGHMQHAASTKLGFVAPKDLNRLRAFHEAEYMRLRRSPHYFLAVRLSSPGPRHRGKNDRREV